MKVLKWIIRILYFANMYFLGIHIFHSEYVSVAIIIFAASPCLYSLQSIKRIETRK